LTKPTRPTRGISSAGRFVSPRVLLRRVQGAGDLGEPPDGLWVFVAQGFDVVAQGAAVVGVAGGLVGDVQQVGDGDPEHGREVEEVGQRRGVAAGFHLLNRLARFAQALGQVLLRQPGVRAQLLQPRAEGAAHMRVGVVAGPGHARNFADARRAPNADLCANS